MAMVAMVVMIITVVDAMVAAAEAMAMVAMVVMIITVVDAMEAVVILMLLVVNKAMTSLRHLKTTMWQRTMINPMTSLRPGGEVKIFSS
jgi:hypothetical protein